ncbi:MAG: hypothetical protein AAGH46_01875, partial [Bacteroidota bacterium]
VQYAISKFKSMVTKTERLPIYFSFGIIGLIASIFWILIFFAPGLSLELVISKFVLASLVLLAIGVTLIIHLKLGKIKQVFYCTLLFISAIGIFVLPLTKAQSATRSEIFESIKTNQIPVFNYEYIAPEVIYLYGDKIPNFSLDDVFYDTNEESFYLLCQNKDPRTNKELVEHYQVEFIKILDFNSAKKDQKNHRSRLVNELYLVKKRS